MAINTFPAVASPVKSVQRGSAAGAGTVTITAIDISKSFVNVFGTTSSGTVAASAALSGGLNAASAAMTVSGQTSRSAGHYGDNNGGPVMNVGGNLNATNFLSANLTGGTNNLVAAVVQGYLSNSTSLVVSGACRWEVVEFN